LLKREIAGHCEHGKLVASADHFEVKKAAITTNALRKLLRSYRPHQSDASANLTAPAEKAAHDSDVPIEDHRVFVRDLAGSIQYRHRDLLHFGRLHLSVGSSKSPRRMHVVQLLALLLDSLICRHLRGAGKPVV
jgi:hypothetical protein